MFDKQWLFDEISKTDQIDNDTNDTILTKLLRKRGISPEDEQMFLNPQAEMLYDPFLPRGMDVAVERILSAVDESEHITVFGDYDADGITATSLLYHFILNVLNGEVDYYIPDRFSEGYGMTAAAVERLAEAGTQLIITVDNGIAAYDAVMRAEELGVDVIITDHHKCPPQIPSCIACIDPQIEGSGFVYDGLAGAGVAYTLVRALADTIGAYDEALIYLPIAALGTIGDCMPLVDENRVIVKAGIDMLARKDWVGINVLFERSGVRSNQTKPISATDIAFRIVPKLNAAGRLGNASRAVELLLAEDEATAEAAASVLIEENKRRQETESSIFEEAVKGGNILTKDSDKCTVAYKEDWHHGVIGIVASRLVEAYGKPSFVFAGNGIDDDGHTIAKGSARSVAGFDLFDALSHCRDTLIGFGGHEMAAGMSIRCDDFARFIDALNEYATSSSRTYMPPHIKADMYLHASELTVDNVKALQKAEPYGEGNPQPLFVTSRLRVTATSKVGEGGKHLKVKLTSIDAPSISFDGISFGNGGFEQLIAHLTNCAVLYTPEINCWNNIETVSMRIVDIHDFDITLEKSRECLYNIRYISADTFFLDRNFTAAVYKAIIQLGRSFTFNDLIEIRLKLCGAGIQCSWYRLRSVVDVLIEIGLVQRVSKMNYVVDDQNKRYDLYSSPFYRSITSEPPK